MTYRRVTLGESGYERIQALKDLGQWVCDAYDHNEPEGCSNSDCFKFISRGHMTIYELLDACIEESERVVQRGDWESVYSIAELRIIENQIVIMRVLRELRGKT